MDVKMRKIKRGKKAQITLFIIIAILIVAAIILFFLLRGKQVTEIFQPSISDPEQYIEKCTRDSVLEAINIILPQGGYISPQNYKLYGDNKVAYLCYTNKYYETCISQQPMYIEFLEKEIKSYIESKIKDCFYSLKQEYQKRQYSVDEDALSLDVELAPKQAEIVINKKFEITKGDETKKYDEFKVKVNSPLYDLAVIAQEIASQEAVSCYFDYLDFSINYPAFEIEKDQVGSEETISDIYKIKDKTTEKQLLIAIRSCALPGGNIR